MDDLILPGIILVIGIAAAVFFLSPKKSEMTLVTNPNPPIIDLVDFTITTKNNATVSYTINMTNMNMGEQQGQAVSQGSGKYVGNGRFSMRGPWRITVTAVLPSGEKLSQNFDYNVR
ncbi:MAG: FixH family protein [bacterium]|nr:FixH family protein [bacterium]